VCRRFWYCGRPRKSAVWAIVQNRGGTLQCCLFAVMCRQQLKLDNMQSEDIDTQFPQGNRTQILRRCDGAPGRPGSNNRGCYGHCQNEQAKEVELAARERQNMKRRRILWVKKWLLRRAQFGQYDKRKYFGRRNFAEGCGCLVEGLRFSCGQYGSFTVFAVSLRFTPFRRFRRILAELNVFNFSEGTRGTCERSRKRAVHLRYICGFLGSV